jgi:uncharacterized protein (TIGR02246 family)
VLDALWRESQHARMSTRVVLTGLLSLFSLFAAGTSPAADTAVQEIIALEEAWARAENAKDPDGLRAIIDERALIVSDGGVRTAEQFIAGVVRGEVEQTQTQTFTDRVVVVDGDTAVSTLVDTLRGTRDGKPYELRFRCTTVYVRRDGKWRAIAEVFNKAPAVADKQ